jgi:CheY-like chemotaxis protein
MACWEMSALVAVEADPPDLVFLGIGMPVMNGYEVAQRLRQRPGLERLLLVGMTGWGQEEDRSRSHEAGFDTISSSPWNRTPCTSCWPVPKGWLPDQPKAAQFSFPNLNQPR